MSEAVQTNLTGVWTGLYTYPRYLQRVLFGATLIESPGRVSGSTHEVPPDGPRAGITLYATLLGCRDLGLVTFTKTYDGTGGASHSIEYEGTLSTDGTEIEGFWMTRANWAGKFLMIRSEGKTQAAMREAFERV